MFEQGIRVFEAALEVVYEVFRNLFMIIWTPKEDIQKNRTFFREFGKFILGVFAKLKKQGALLTNKQGKLYISQEILTILADELCDKLCIAAQTKSHVLGSKISFAI